jgi:DNA (cytosine-5)-methyltransferase 1
MSSNDTEFKDDIEIRELESVIPYGENPKEHPTEQVDKIASSIQRFGWDQPIVVDDSNVIIKGHGRYQAAQKLGLNDVPVIEQTELSDAEVRAARIADNRVAESEWNDELLSVEMELIEESELDTELTGFETDEIEELSEPNSDDQIDELDADPIQDKSLEDIKILDLYAGIGGNRKLWGDEPDVTAVEYNETIAEAYRDFFPGDTVIVDDAHEYLLEHFQEFDFIWSSPPCPTHSKLRKNLAVETGAEPVYPDLKLYQEILLLQGYFDGGWVVENVDPWYDPLIQAQKSGRHMFWASFDVPELNTGPTISRDGSSVMDSYDADEQAREFGYDPDRLRDFKFPSDYPYDKVVNNMVHPEVGKVILESAIDVFE